MIERVLRRCEWVGDCRIWQGATTNGYGVIQRGRRGEGTMRTHVAVWEHHHGPKPPGLDVKHSCDIKACCEIDHLSLGTRQVNMDEAVDRERTSRGEAHYRAVLTEQAVREIRALKGVVSGNDLAARFGVSRGTIYSIQGGHRWKWL